MARNNFVKKARKGQGTCGRCGAEINAGDPYVWFKNRYGPKRVYCGEREDRMCMPRASEKTSGKLGEVYAAQESFDDTIQSFSDDFEGLRDALQELGEEVRRVADEYGESAENIREHIPDSPTADECEEKQGELEGWADEIERVAEEYSEHYFEILQRDEDDAEFDQDERDEAERELNEWKDNAESVGSECPV